MWTGASTVVKVDWNRHGTWNVHLPDLRARVECDTLSDAKRLARIYAAQRPSGEIVVRDAYHRVLEREALGDGASTGSGGDDVERAAVGPQSGAHFPVRVLRGAPLDEKVRRPISRRRT